MPNPSLLLSLADELILAILQELSHDPASLCQLARTCFRLQALSEPFLYDSILLRSGSRATKLRTALKARPERAAAIRSLNMRCLYEYVDGMAEFNPVVRDLRMLREWAVESPFCNYIKRPTWVEEDMEVFRRIIEDASVVGSMRIEERPLQCLQSFTLHSHGPHTRYWSLTSTPNLTSLFLHPTLRHISLSCCTMLSSPALAILSTHAATTPLTTLIFDECNINASALTHILRVPKALKHLTLGENAYHWSDRLGLAELPVSAEPAKLFEALKLQSPSLETLTHISQSGTLAALPEVNSYDLNLAVFESLIRLEITPSSPLLHTLHHSPSPATAPPQLRALRVFNPPGVPSATFPPTMLHKLPQLREIEMLYTTHASPNLAEGMWGNGRAQDTHKFARGVKDRYGGQIRFRVFVELLEGVIPPFFWDEIKAEGICVFDSDSQECESGAGEEGGDVGGEVGGELKDISEAGIEALKVRTKRVVEEWIEDARAARKRRVAEGQSSGAGIGSWDTMIPL